ncbi:MAG TPA: DUF1844 domain-containing protein [Thermoanaerobaculia bacterium]|nr:DUF1844 domain-containing protein [Thermoanaerobaculia bacterium]
MANEKKEIKVTDKRMFTPDGKLREEYRFLDEKSTAAPVEPPAAEPPAAPAAETRRPEPPPREPPRPAAPAARAEVELPPMPPDLEGPSFFDLVAMLAEPVPIYLGDARLPDGQSAENPEMARFYIDLMDVLRQKTLGNLSAEESAFLEDLLYRLRVRYVQKSRE